METIQQPTKTKANKDHKCDFCCETIKKGTYYLKSVHKYDEVYSWKTHENCAEIASTLKMYDYADEGVTTDDFWYHIKEEYQKIMSDTQNELYKSKDFIYPKFSEQLEFVINHHNVEENTHQNQNTP